MQPLQQLQRDLQAVLHAQEIGNAESGRHGCRVRGAAHLNNGSVMQRERTLVTRLYNLMLDTGERPQGNRE